MKVNRESERCQTPVPRDSDYIGFLCSLKKGHYGDHAAHWSHDLHEEAAVVWPGLVSPQEVAEVIESIKTSLRRVP